MARVSPVSESISVEQLRLGYTIIDRQADGRWFGQHVYYLAEDRYLAGKDMVHMRYFDLADLEVATDRVLNPEDHRFDPLPLPERLLDMPEGPRSTKLWKRTLSRKSRSLPVRPRYDVSHKDRFLKHVPAEDLADIGLDHRTMRYAAQTLHPGANVTVRDHRGSTVGRIKAVGFGVGGPIGILLHNAPVMGSDRRAQATLESDNWINAATADIAVHDKKSSLVLVNLFHLRHMTVLDHAL